MFALGANAQINGTGHCSDYFTNYLQHFYIESYEEESRFYSVSTIKYYTDGTLSYGIDIVVPTYDDAVTGESLVSSVNIEQVLVNDKPVKFVENSSLGLLSVIGNDNLLDKGFYNYKVKMSAPSKKNLRNVNQVKINLLPSATSSSYDFTKIKNLELYFHLSPNLEIIGYRLPEESFGYEIENDPPLGVLKLVGSGKKVPSYLILRFREKDTNFDSPVFIPYAINQETAPKISTSFFDVVSHISSIAVILILSGTLILVLLAVDDYKMFRRYKVVDKKKREKR